MVDRQPGTLGGSPEDPVVQKTRPAIGVGVEQHDQDRPAREVELLRIGIGRARQSRQQIIDGWLGLEQGHGQSWQAV
jgi:hypothetical protein